MRTLALLTLLAAHVYGAAHPFFDRTHDSRVFGQPRHYRLFLPPGYDSSRESYPVIYYFHGHGDRYTLEHYDNGADTVPKIATFVAAHGVIVVSVDGYVAEAYQGFYGGTPWDVMEDGGKHDFGEYFLELVSHIDTTLRTLTDRRHRATSGLSMGGFMSLYLSARYPDRIGSASAFNPGPEFYAGEPGRRVLWRPKDHIPSHQHTMIRLVRASGDYISQYHEETRAAYARQPGMQFEFRQDEYHRHWATSIGETFEFHMRAFGTPELNNVPERWSYASPYGRFSAWGWDVECASREAGLTELEGVSQTGFRVITRRWAPDGPAVAGRAITITTAPLYAAGRSYAILDYSLALGAASRREVKASADGRIRIAVDGSGHQIGIAGPGSGAQPPVLLPMTAMDRLRLRPGREVVLPVRVFNPRGEAMKDVHVTLTTEYPTVEVIAGQAEVASLNAGAATDLTSRFRIRCTSGAGDYALARLTFTLSYDGWHSSTEVVDILIAPDVLPTPLAVQILDGRTATFDVFRQKGNQGGGESVKRTVTEGKGNGNGVLEPGEEATIWVKLAQGLDPFDKGNWYRAKVYSDSPSIVDVADLAEPKQREWTGAKERTSVIRLSAEAVAGEQIPLILSNESWSFHFTPDVRYGTENLYQAFQLHMRHTHLLQLNVPGTR